MAQMRLDLQLNGVTSMTQAIGKLNSAISTLNQILNRTAISISALANRLNNLSGVIPTKMAPSKSGGGGGGKGKEGGEGGGSAQDAYSLLFSIFSGAGRNVQAKVFNQFLRSMNLSTVVLVKFAFKLGVVVAVLYGVIKAFQKTNDALMKISEDYYARSFAGGSLANNARIESLAMIAGLDSKEVAADVASRPGGWNQFIAELDRFLSLSGEARRIYAMQVNPNLARYTSLEDKPNWREQVENQRFPNLKQQMAEFNGSVETLWREAVEPFKMLMGQIGTALKGVAAAVLWVLGRVVYLYQWISDKFPSMNWPFTKDLKEASKDMKKAASDMKDAANANKKGVVGGAERARGAIPTAWTWNASMMINNARNLGAFEY